MNEWIAVQDKLPEAGVWVLVWTGRFHWIAMIDDVYGNGDLWSGTYENEYWDEPTHWRPLPEPPQDPAIEAHSDAQQA